MNPFSPRQSAITYLMWGLLIWAGGFAMATGNWTTVFIASVTLALTFLPIVLQSWSGIRIPNAFTGAIVFFLVATLFLGEVGDFYERFWWWDVVLHTGSAIGFGMIGTILILMLLGADRMTGSPRLVALFAFMFGVAIGAVWEIFEFAMDQMFGLNMQKSGLVDTMYDLIVDCVGAAVGAFAGYAYLKGKQDGWLSGMIGTFVADNRRLFDREEEQDAA
ncbi:MAG: hypothetical protein ACTS1X_04670 [Parasphingopyxis sp.]|uniref:hypothetical protein n=1 Tax=Parasphingopyxis sp. TaxID=1920299 RepID=UPI003FA110C9